MLFMAFTFTVMIWFSCAYEFEHLKAIIFGRLLENKVLSAPVLCVRDKTNSRSHFCFFSPPVYLLCESHAIFIAYICFFHSNMKWGLQLLSCDFTLNPLKSVGNILAVLKFVTSIPQTSVCKILSSMFFLQFFIHLNESIACLAESGNML